jgi:hypothetical protein
MGQRAPQLGAATAMPNLASPMPQLGPGGPPQMSAQGPSFGGDGMIMMRAPNGQTARVPSHLASQFEQRGAVRVQ